MTWEWAFVVAMFLLCFTTLLCVAVVFVSTEGEEDSKEMDLLRAEIETLKAEQQAAISLAQESKKMISDTNLALGIGRLGRGQR
jgi:hypothetical protein